MLDLRLGTGGFVHSLRTAAVLALFGTVCGE